MASDVQDWVGFFFFLCCRETTAVWVSIDVPSTQAPGQYEGEVIITALKTDAEYIFLNSITSIVLSTFHLFHMVEEDLVL